MKLQLRLLAVMLAGVMVFAQAAPEKTAQEARPKVEASEDPIAKYASPGEDAVGDLLLQAMSLLGVAYRFGGNSPVSGLDCSGFVRYVFQKSLKVNLPRTSAEMARIGKPVDKSELVAGDLVFFNTRGFAYSHVGMYMGNGKFIHAPRTGRNIEVVSLNQSYWQSRWNGARRINRSNVNTVAAADEVDSANDSVAARSGAAAAPKMKCRKGKKCKPVAEAASSKKKAGKGSKSAHGGKADKPAKAAKSGHGKKKKPAN
ncbi:C40 family peptidase [Aquitalea sp. LB_tupeE]|uniref:C40 family peptidase n=1 Tax=Aquitalea sp. LB_tupeE TaxID=2748078 RepID=UPI0015B94018|nr:C40 family peptidase [Aquitalea sp. LB_tupeE]NWK76567.1 C40 family peptidase [Aquitalea sp. LB_tupeE]